MRATSGSTSTHQACARDDKQNFYKKIKNELILKLAYYSEDISLFTIHISRFPACFLRKNEAHE